MRKMSVLAMGILLTAMICSVTMSEGPPPPSGWGKPAAIPPANGQGKVTFTMSGKEITLPLNKIEIDTSKEDMMVVSLTYIDEQENKLELHFSSMRKPEVSNPPLITGFVVRSKELGISKSSHGKSKCDLAITKLTAEEVAGTLSCTGMTDMSAENPAPDVTDVKFEGKISNR